MARVTIEDCLDYVDNRFHLVLVASKRARELSNTAAEPFVPWDKDKPTVVALREIAAGFVKDGNVCDPNAAEPEINLALLEELSMEQQQEDHE